VLVLVEVHGRARRRVQTGPVGHVAIAQARPLGGAVRLELELVELDLAFADIFEIVLVNGRPRLRQRQRAEET
jgi:hypothetical protein